MVKNEEVMQFTVNMSINKVKTKKVMQVLVNMGISAFTLIRAIAYFL